MSDDRSDQKSVLTRRKILSMSGATAAAAVAGCVGGDSNSSTNGTVSSAETEAATTIQESVYSGETIPPTSYDDLASQPPTVATPAPDVENPILTADDVDDFGAVDYVADPYLFVEGDTWHLFFEVVNSDRSPDAAIGLATSTDGLDWTYDGIALAKQSHTSYPFIWKYEGEYYMAPADGRAVDLWRATAFPSDWERLGTVIEEEYFTHDPVFARYDDRWWLFTSRENEDVMAFHAEELTADQDAWTAHANNPVVSDRRHAARQGGRPVVIDDTLHLFFQDLEYEYGDQIRGFRVTELSTERYADEEVAHSPIITGFGSGWNARKMHHYDPWAVGDDQGWRCAVDGAQGPSGNEVEWGIGIYDVPTIREADQSAIPYDAERTAAFVRFDGESAVAVDDSGNENHGMIRGTETVDVGGCPGRRFPDSDDRVVFPTTLDPIGSEEYTLFFRGQLRSPESPQTLFSYTSRHVNRRLAARFDPDVSGWQFDFDGTADRVQPTPSADLSKGSPFQLAIAYSRGDGYRIFQDGSALTQVRDVGDIFHEVCLPVLGSTLPGQLSWQGDISHFGVFDDALDTEDLQSFSSLCSSN